MSVDMYQTLAHIACLTETFKTNKRYCVVLLILMELGIATQHDGYEYLIKTILLYCDNPSPVTMRELYSRVADMYANAVSEAQIEHAIRCAIKAAWKKHDESAWIRYFSPGRDGKLEKPSNTEFITRVARVVELWEGCCKEHFNKTCKEDKV